MLRRWFTREIDQNLCTDLHTRYGHAVRVRCCLYMQAEAELTRPCWVVPVALLALSMFNLTIQGQASAEQQAEWMPLVLSKGIIGTYAQTVSAGGQRHDQRCRHGGAKLTQLCWWNLTN